MATTGNGNGAPWLQPGHGNGVPWLQPETATERRGCNRDTATERRGCNRIRGPGHGDQVAIAEQAGGMWNSQEKRVGKMPPVLLIHGRADRKVPFAKYAAPLERVLHAHGGKVETHFFNDEDHVFTPPAMAAVRRNLVDYFGRALPWPAGQGGKSAAAAASD